MFEQINILPVLVSALLSVAVGSIWYSPLLFGPLWMKTNGLPTPNREISHQEMLRGIIKGVSTQVVFFLIIAQFVAFSIAGERSLLTIGILLTGLLMVQMTSSVLWERRPLSYLLINAGYCAIVLFGGLGVIAFWPW